MDDSFYREFEDKLRGSRELIKSRLKVYGGFLEPLRTLASTRRAIDLGCGRGEWLELLRDHGLQGLGVDLDDGMLAACREIGLDVRHADALAVLKETVTESAVLVSAFHVAEHLRFEDLRTLATEALRVLVPGGLLILETPNPENLYVGSSNFYLDPSHNKPIPQPLLTFIAEHAGFERHVVMRLQEEPGLRGSAPVTLLSVLTGVSPDYAVVAQKNAENGILDRFDSAFAKTYGLSLPELAQRYDLERNARIQHCIESAANAAKAQADISARLAAAEARTSRAEARCAITETRCAVLETQVNALARLANDNVVGARNGAGLHAAARGPAEVQSVEEAEQRIQAIYMSTSWRITAPLRMASSVVRGLAGPHRVATLAAISRRLGIYPIARAMYRFVRPASPAEAASPAPAPGSSVAPSPAPLNSGDLSDDAQLVARQLDLASEYGPKAR